MPKLKCACASMQKCNGGKPCLPCTRARTYQVCEYPPGVGESGHRRPELPKGAACTQCRERKRRCDGQSPCETCIGASRPHLCEFRPKKTRFYAGYGCEDEDDRDASPGTSSSASSSSGIYWTEPTIAYSNGVCANGEANSRAFYAPQNLTLDAIDYSDAWSCRASVESTMSSTTGSECSAPPPCFAPPVEPVEDAYFGFSPAPTAWHPNAGSSREVDEYIALLDMPMPITMPQCLLESQVTDNPAANEQLAPAQGVYNAQYHGHRVQQTQYGLPPSPLPPPYHDYR
ncbi:hypothetical protein MKEN_00531800 [Mycena kentingensis (nom. inval.)]|nr:hypothetical protein MKEN_00531800 [Mycena kentingensis (nom. inval.)]